MLKKSGGRWPQDSQVHALYFFLMKKSVIVGNLKKLKSPNS